MKVKVCDGREVDFRGTRYSSGALLSVPDEVADRWLKAGDVQTMLRAKPIRPPRSSRT